MLTRADLAEGGLCTTIDSVNSSSLDSGWGGASTVILRLFPGVGVMVFCTGASLLLDFTDDGGWRPADCTDALRRFWPRAEATAGLEPNLNPKDASFNSRVLCGS
jgi:hypothetical protein